MPGRARRFVASPPFPKPPAPRPECRCRHAPATAPRPAFPPGRSCSAGA